MRRETLLTPDCSAVRGGRLLVALSGGADSVALLSMLSRARKAYGLTLFAAHLDHGIRPESAEDAAFCRALCENLDVPFLCRRIDVPAEAARRHVGLETLARQLRYEWLRQCKAETRSDCIALAHHMDDQAETVLMHLARGAGPEGIRGMATLSGDLYRPLLGIRREDLRQFLRDRGMDWREDATNALPDTPRNALRLHGIPALEQSYPQVVPAIARYAEAARMESDYVAEQTEAYLRAAAVPFPLGFKLELAPMPHPAILRRAIRAVTENELSHERIAAAASLAEAARGRAELSGAWLAERGRGGLYILWRGVPPFPETPLEPEDETEVASLCTLIASPAPACPIPGDPMLEALRREALVGAVVRTRRPGDRFRPLGCGDRLLSDYLTDRKIDRPVRDALALVARDDRVLWVCGVGMSEDAKLRGPDDDAVRVRCRYPFDMRRLLK